MEVTDAKKLYGKVMPMEFSSEGNFDVGKQKVKDQNSKGKVEDKIMEEVVLSQVDQNSGVGGKSGTINVDGSIKSQKEAKERDEGKEPLYKAIRQDQTS